MVLLKKSSYIVAGFAILIAIWQSAVWFGGFHESLLPAPYTVLQGVISLIQDGTLFEHIRVSLGRFIAGYSIAVVAAIMLGLVLGQSRILWQLVDPIVQVLRPIAPIAWSPFIILWFNIGNASAIVIIFLAAFYPVLLSTVSAVRKVGKDYLRVAQNFEVKRHHLLMKIIFPAAFPFIANGLHIAIGMAWIFLVAGEMLGAQSGLGYLIVDSRNLLRLDLVLVAIIFIGVLGMLLDKAIGLLENWINRHWGNVKA